MTRQEIREESRRAFREWGAALVAHHAVPILLLSVGVDHADGKQFLYTTHDTADLMLLQILEGSARELRRRLKLD